MTNEEAIKILKLNVSSENGGFYKVAVELAIEALRKQMPRKCVEKDGYFVCSICRKPVVYDDAYCHNCGQALDWSEYE